jgi:hypothetical protein
MLAEAFTEVKNAAKPPPTYRRLQIYDRTPDYDFPDKFEY